MPSASARKSRLANSLRASRRVRLWRRPCVQLNHTIVWCRDERRSAAFLAEILGRPAPTRFGPFLVVEVDNGASLDFHQVDGEVASQHYAFLVGEDDFDAIFGRIRERGLKHW